MSELSPLEEKEEEAEKSLGTTLDKLIELMPDMKQCLLDEFNFNDDTMEE